MAVGSGSLEVHPDTGKGYTAMRSTLSFDQRFINAAAANDFMSTFQRVVENPQYMNLGLVPPMRRVTAVEIWFINKKEIWKKNLVKISDLKICLSMDGFTHYAQPQIQSLEVITLHVTPTQDGPCDGLSVAGLRGCNLICAFGSVKNMEEIIFWCQNSASKLFDDSM